jgi:ClpP class serine protease
MPPISFEELQEMVQEDIDADGPTVYTNNITDVEDAISGLNPDQQAILRELVNKRIARIKQDLPKWRELSNYPDHRYPYGRPGERVQNLEGRRRDELGTERNLLQNLKFPKSTGGGRRKSRRNRKSKKSRKKKNKTRKRR